MDIQRIKEMISPESYFKEHELYDAEKLRQHCDHNFVRYITSERFPGLVMLHYADECAYEKKWGTFSRMSRGLIVDLKNRKILAHPFDKFFNLDEMPETKYDVLTTKGSFEVSEKLDGSMLTLFQDPNTGDFHMTTKGSFDSEHGIYATSIMPKHLKDATLVRDHTLVFELISPKFPNVINYTKKEYIEGLYLVGMRHKRSNSMAPFLAVKAFAQTLRVPAIKTYSFNTLDEIIDNVKGLPVLEEGYVLRFKPEIFVKIKGPAYLAAHRFISRLSDKYILEALMIGAEGELVDIAPEEYRDDVEIKIRDYKRQKLDITNMCYEKFNEAPKTTRKEYALHVQKNVDKPFQSFMFDIYLQKPLKQDRLYKVIGQIEGVSAKTRI